MKIAENFKLALRAAKARPIETTLLILGISLGIGATSSGVSMIGNSIREKQRVLDSTTYKEIVVQVREEASDMETPAVVVQEGADVVLSWKDLVAKYEVADIEYAYLADSARFRLANFGTGPPENTGGQTRDKVTTPAPAPESLADGGETSTKNTTDPQSVAQAAPSVAPPAAAEIDGPQPAIDEIPGMYVSAEYFDAWNLVPAAGGVFTQREMEVGAKVMVVGAALGDSLFEDGDALGRELLVQRSIYTIIGILEPTGTSVDEMGIVPAEAVDVNSIRNSMRKFMEGGSSLHFTVYDSSKLDEAKAQLEIWFAQEYGQDRVTISIPRAEVEATQDRSSRLITVILFLAIAGLLIASVNVSNILLGRAMKRRRSIGILKALGATKRGVFAMFYLEALFVGVAGACIGLGVSVLMSTLVPGVFSGAGIAFSVLFAGVVGAWLITTTMTVVPALQASRVSPAQALRYE